MAGSLVDLSGADDASNGTGNVVDLSGGAIPDGGNASANGGASTGGAGANPHSDVVNTALSTVQDALNYGRQKYGLGGSGENPAPGKYAPYEGVRQSDDIEDRRDDASAPTEGDTGRTKFDDVVDRGREFVAGFNPMSQAAGINDVASARGAIPEEEGGE